jgi:hypothetical protein
MHCCAEERTERGCVRAAIKRNIALEWAKLGPQQKNEETADGELQRKRRLPSTPWFDYAALNPVSVRSIWRRRCSGTYPRNSNQQGAHGTNQQETPYPVYFLKPVQGVPLLGLQLWKCEHGQDHNATTGQIDPKDPSLKDSQY